MEDWFLINHQSGAIGHLGEKPDASSQRTEEPTFEEQDLSKRFFSKVAEARQLHRTIEQLTVNIVDHPGPKSAVTVGDVLTTLESLNWGTLPRHKSFWVTIQKTCNELQTCIESMQDIIEATKGYVRRPTSVPVPDGRVSMWMSEIATGAFAKNLEKYTKAMHRAATQIAEQDVEILQGFSGK